MNMVEMIEKMTVLVKDLEKNNTTVIACNADNEQIMVLAKIAGIPFEYGYNAKTKTLFVTCNGQVIEEMTYEL